MIDLVLSLITLSAAALLAGAYYLWRRRGANRQSGLMVLLAMIMLANVAIWAWPTASGDTLQDAAAGR